MLYGATSTPRIARENDCPHHPIPFFLYINIKIKKIKIHGRDNHDTNFLMFWFCSTTQTHRYQHSPPFSKLKFVASIDLLVLLSSSLFCQLVLSFSYLYCRHSRCGCHRTTISAYQPATASVYQHCYSSLIHQLKLDYYFSIQFKRQ